MKYIKLLEIQPGGWLLLSVLLFLLDYELFSVVILCVMIHESGHLFLLDLFHVRVRRITLDLTGFTIHYNAAFLNGVHESMVAVAGPSVGLMAAVLFSFIGNLIHNDFLLLFSGANAVLSIFNLLPAKPLDGWRFLHVLCPVLAQIFSFFTAFIVLTIGVFLMYAGYGTTLALMGIILLLQEVPQRNLRRFRNAY